MITVNIPAVSHAIGAGAFLALTLLLLTAWRGRLQGGLLVAATAVTALWCAAVAGHAVYRTPPFSALQLLEILRNAAWCLFLLKLLGFARAAAGGGTRLVRVLFAIILALCVGLAGVIIVNRYSADIAAVASMTAYVAVFGHVILAVAGLVVVEQIYRNTPAGERWAVKFLCIGVGGLFVYDFYMYANALLFRQLDGALWSARGLVNAMVVPLVAVSARRNPHWSLDVFVSRHVVFHTAALLGAGVYLLGMAAAGYYIRVYGGTWGGVAQVVFLAGAVLLLGALVQSGKLRSRAKVFVNKHFFRNKYDYREEWLRFTHTLSSREAGAELKQTILRAIADLMESPGGVLWLREETGRFEPVASEGVSLRGVRPVETDAPLAAFLERRGWVVNLDEHAANPDHYDGIAMPDWGELGARLWVVVPLMQAERLVGLIALSRSTTKTDFNWEDSDLLKTVGRQAASYLVLWQTSDALSEARQFEAFNRLSAFVVHDLKNVVAQLGLVVANAEKHMHKPEFVADAFRTVDNAIARMNRMLGQLRKDRLETGAARAVSLAKVVESAVAARSAQRPVPELESCAAEVRVSAEPERLTAVLEHLIQNAQEATPPEGSVKVRARGDGKWASVEIEDTGCGMDERFIAERLFKPFDTTKGNAGMGVGVYESREFVHSLGGDIAVESEPRRGTLFRIRIPAMSAPERAAG